MPKDQYNAEKFEIAEIICYTYVMLYTREDGHIEAAESVFKKG